MAKRLTDKQQRRIQKKQTSRLKSFQSGNTNKQEYAARVITNYGKKIIAELDDGRIIPCITRRNIEKTVCGDRVLIELKKNTEGAIVAITPRESLLKKPGFGGKLKPMAANIDQVIIVTSTQPEPNSYLIDRYLVAAENMPATAIIVINKSDIEGNEEQLSQIEKAYTALGYPVIRTSKFDTDSLQHLKQHLLEKTSILVGLSGVGKSSLIDKLVPDHDIRIGEVSEASGEGTHTTTNSMLYHMHENGDLIDSPGVRDFGLWDLPAENILNGFIEFRDFAGTCKFSDCTHRAEPGCMIVNAVSSGKISEQRYQHYLKMIDEYAVN